MWAIEKRQAFEKRCEQSKGKHLKRDVRNWKEASIRKEIWQAIEKRCEHSKRDVASIVASIQRDVVSIRKRCGKHLKEMWQALIQKRCGKHSKRYVARDVSIWKRDVAIIVPSIQTDMWQAFNKRCEASIRKELWAITFEKRCEQLKRDASNRKRCWQARC